MGARCYDPDVGRWLSEDPKQDQVFDPLSLNFYVYVNNAPVTLVDPNGEHARVAVLIAGLAVPGVREASLQW